MKVFTVLVLCFVGVSAVSKNNLTLFEIGKQHGSLSVFLQLGEQSGLADAMKKPGQWTLFAPTDLAFMEFSGLETLRTNATLLQNFLKYHVVKGIYMKKDLDANDMELQSVSGANIRVNLYRSTRSITVEGSKINNFDNVGSNGVVHIVDEVLIAPENNLYLTLKNNPKFSIFAKYLALAGLDKELENGPYTVFAPGNDAFNKLDDESLQRLGKDKEVLAELLKYHIVHGVLWKAGMHSTFLETLTGHDKIFIRKSFFGMLTVENAIIIDRDISATNGVIHELHSVLEVDDVRGAIIG